MKRPKEDYDEDGGIYTEEGREELEEEEDELTDLDSGFMQGYNVGGKLAKCALCKKPLGDDFVEEEINEQLYRFCSDEHAEKYMEKRLKS